MSVFYLLREDGGKITLENGSGAITLEASTVSGSSFYLLKEDGGKINLEDGTGAILLEEGVVVIGPTVDWQAGGSGHPTRKKRRNETEELFRDIEHSLEVALGIADEPLEVSATAVVEEAIPTWSEERYREAIARLEKARIGYGDVSERLLRLQSMFRAYEEAQARERALQDDEETWFLMS